MKSIISKYIQLSFLFTVIFLLTDLHAQRRSSSRSSSNDTTSVRSSKSERQRTSRNPAPARTRARTSERTITSFGDANQYIGSWTFESLFVPDIVDQVEDDSTGELVDVEIEEVEAGQELDGMMVDEDSDVEELNEMDFVLEIYEDGNAAFVFDTVLAVLTGPQMMRLYISKFLILVNLQILLMILMMMEIQFFMCLNLLSQVVMIVRLSRTMKLITNMMH